MPRTRKPGYITGEASNDFGLDVPVRPQVKPKSEFYPSGDPIPDGQTGLAPKDGSMDYKRRDPIPPGVIGSDAGDDMAQMGPPQYIDTVEHYPGEQSDPTLHGSPAVIRSAGRTDVPFQSYATFQPRRAPMPRAAQDEGLLEPYGYHAADPLMTDYDSTDVLGPRPAQRVNLSGKNRDGVAHNNNDPRMWPNSDPLYYNAPEPPPDMSKLKETSNTIARNAASKAGAYRKTGR